MFQSDTSDTKLPNVTLFIAGTHARTQQDYPNLTIIQDDTKNVADWFNEQLTDLDDNQIYGLISPNDDFTDSDAVSIIVDKMLSHELIHNVYADSIIVDENNLPLRQYLPPFHIDAVNSGIIINCPLFYTGAALKEKRARLLTNLQHLYFYFFFLLKSGHIMSAHIAEPLYITHTNSSVDIARDLGIIHQCLGQRDTQQQ